MEGIPSQKKINKLVKLASEAFSASKERTAAAAEQLSRLDSKFNWHAFSSLSRKELLEFVLKSDNKVLTTMKPELESLIKKSSSKQTDPYLDKNLKNIQLLQDLANDHERADFADVLLKLIDLKIKFNEVYEDPLESIFLRNQAQFDHFFMDRSKVNSFLIDGKLDKLIYEFQVGDKQDFSAASGGGYSHLKANALIFDEEVSPIEKADFDSITGPMFCLEVGEDQIVVHHTYFEKAANHPTATDLPLKDFFETDKKYDGKPLAIYVVTREGKGLICVQIDADTSRDLQGKSIEKRKQFDAELKRDQDAATARLVSQITSGQAEEQPPMPPSPPGTAEEQQPIAAQTAVAQINQLMIVIYRHFLDTPGQSNILEFAQPYILENPLNAVIMNVLFEIDQIRVNLLDAGKVLADRSDYETIVINALKIQFESEGFQQINPQEVVSSIIGSMQRVVNADVLRILVSEIQQKFN